jgi:tetratricopeptide (TPR) repeat protein
VELIDVEELFASKSLHGTPGRELFYEHVHMNPHGNYEIAQALLPRVVDLLPEEVRRSAANENPPSEEQANRLLALTAHDRGRVAETVRLWLNQPPFTNRLDNPEELQALRQETGKSEDLKETAAAYRWAIEKAPDDRWLHFNYALALEAHDPAEAAAEFRRALELLPNNYEVHEKLADALIAMGEYKEAIAQCRELLRMMPYHAPAYLTIAFAQAKLKSFDESIASYEQAIALHPAYGASSFNQIGIIQLHQGQFELAAASFKKGLLASKEPAQIAELKNNLANALRRLGRYSEAREVTERADLWTSSKP